MKKIFFGVLTIVSTLTYAQTQHTGLLLDDVAYSQVPVKARNVSFQSVVEDVSSASLKKFVPTIRNQGSYGTCVGWSSSYYGRTILNARKENLTSKNIINQNTYAPVYTYLNSNVEDDYNCQGGAYIHEAMQVLVNKGVPLLSEFDVMCSDQISSSLEQKARKNKIKDYNRLFSSDETDLVKLESMKRSLINGNPVIIGFMIEKAFYSAQNVFVPNGGEIEGGHAMCVVGFDDDKYNGAFEIVNSWGESWGNEGFIWVRYEDFLNYTKYAYEMIPYPNEVETKKTLAGEIYMKMSDGSKMKVKKGNKNYSNTVLGWQDVVIEESSQSIGDYETAEIYPDGSRYRMYTRVNKPAYVYVIGADSEGQNGVLFPHKSEISPYIAYENTEVIIPGEKYWFRLNSQVNSDYSVVIFSENSIDIQNVKMRLDDMEGELLDKLYVIFNEELISKEKVSLDPQKMAFNAEYNSGTLTMMILDIKRR